jgi:Pretoxin HINT domain
VYGYDNPAVFVDPSGNRGFSVNLTVLSGKACENALLQDRVDLLRRDGWSVGDGFIFGLDHLAVRNPLTRGFSNGMCAFAAGQYQAAVGKFVSQELTNYAAVSAVNGGFKVGSDIAEFGFKKALSAAGKKCGGAVVIGLGTTAATGGTINSSDLAIGCAAATNTPGTAISRACRTGNSFASGTEVVMADGSRKAISELKVGDRVLATDTETGLTAARAVTAVHLNLDIALANVIVVDDDGDVSTINTTQHHPFWNVSDSKWTDVIDLDNGDRLRSTDGSLITVVSVRSFTGEQWMWDLTVDEIHSFYVANGDEPILVHNCGDLDEILSTAHGRDRLIGRGFDSVDIDLIKASPFAYEQASGGFAHVAQLGPNSFGVVVVGGRGVISAMRGLTRKELNNLARNHGWTGYP